MTVELQPRGEHRQAHLAALATTGEPVARASAVTRQTDVPLILRLRDMEEFDGPGERPFCEDRNLARCFTMAAIHIAKEEAAIRL